MKELLQLLREILAELKKLSFQSKKVFTTQEVAEICSTYPAKVNIWRKAGLIQGIKKGQEFIYTNIELDRFLKENTGKDLSIYK